MGPNKETAKENKSMKMKGKIDPEHTDNAKNSTPQANLGEVLSAELEKTDLGHLINEYKNLVIAFVVFFILSAMGYTAWKAMKSNEYEQSRSIIEEFKKNNLDNIEPKEINLEKLYSNYRELISKIKNGNFLLELTPSILEGIKIKNAYTQNDWIGLFQNAKSLCSKADFCFNHFSSVLVVVFEEQGKIPEALKEYEGLVGNEYVVEDRLYFELARLSSKLNLVEKKKSYIDFLRKNHPSSEYKSLAEQL